MVEIVRVRTASEVADAALLMRALAAANMALYRDDAATIEAYYRSAWFNAADPHVPSDYRPPRGEVLLARCDNASAGTIAISRMDNRHVELKSMFVPPEHRRRGIAEALCAAALRVATEQGYGAVRLTTGHRQGGARALYARLGFLPVVPWEADPPPCYDYFERAL